jgi:hypothetical protein
VEGKRAAGQSASNVHTFIRRAVKAIEDIKPTVLIDVSALAGLFSRGVIRDIGLNARSVIFALPSHRKSRRVKTRGL